MQTLRYAFGSIVTWQRSDDTIADVGALTASVAHEGSPPLFKHRQQHQRLSADLGTRR